MSPYIPQQSITLYRIVLRYSILYLIILYYTILCYIILYINIISYYIISLLRHEKEEKKSAQRLLSCGALELRNILWRDPRAQVQGLREAHPPVDLPEEVRVLLSNRHGIKDDIIQSDRTELYIYIWSLSKDLEQPGDG